MVAERAIQRHAEVTELTCPYDNQYQGPRKRLLFVCSAGMLRSPTAAAVATSLGHNARSCGSALDYALIPISVNLVYWADKIYFVKMDNYLEALEVFQFDKATQHLVETKRVIWDLEDEHDYMHPDLVKIVTRLLSN